MSAGRFNFTINKGSTFNYVATLYSDESATTAINLSGYTARMQIRKKKDDTLIDELTTENSGITLGGSAGTITLNISSSNTTSMTAQQGVYDIEIISGSGQVTRILQGYVNILGNVTV